MGPRRYLRNPVDDYAATNLHLYRKTLMGADLGITMRNAFDVDARDPSSGPSPISDDIPLAGMEIWGELRFRW